MAGRSDIKAGRAFVELFLKNHIKRGLNEASKQLKSFGMGAMRLGSQIAGVGAAMTAAFIAPIKAAGDLMETTSKFGAVFGSEAQDATKWMEAFGESVGRGRKELMDGMSSFQAFFSGMGLGAKEAAGFSKELTALSVDFASFHNMSDPEAMQRFISALSGSGEVLSMYGVNIMEAALNQKLLAMGFPTISKGATETQKVLARMSIIKESMGRQGAVGDAIKTAGSFSNQLKKMRGELANTAAEIGNALLPVVTPLVSWVAEAVKQFAAWAKENQAFVRMAFKAAIAITAIGTGIATAGAIVFGAGALIGATLTGITIVAGAVGLAFKLLLTPIGLVTAALVGGTIYWLRYTDSGKAAVKSMTSYITDLFNDLLKTFKETWGGISDALKAGDLALAGEIAMAGLQVAFYKGTNGIYKAFLDVKLALMSSWQELHTELAKTFTTWYASIQIGWVNLMSFLESNFTKAKNFIQDANDLFQLGIKQKVIQQEVDAGNITPAQGAQLMEDFRNETLGNIGARMSEESGITADRDRRLQDIREGLQRELGRFDSENNTAQNALNRDYERGLGARQGAQADAEAKLAQLRDDAFWKSVVTDMDAAKKKADQEKELQDQLAAGQAGIGGLAKGGSVVGAINSAAAVRLGGSGGPLKPVVNAIERMDARQKKAQMKEDALMMRQLEAMQKNMLQVVG